MANATSGIIKRGSTYHIDKQYLGERIRGSCKTSDYNQALEILAIKMEQIRQAKNFGVRQTRTFREAATHYLNTKVKRSLADDAMHLKLLDPYIGELALDRVYDETLQPFIAARRATAKKAKTINRSLEVVRHILYLCAASWRDDGLTWLIQAPKITMLKIDDASEPYPLTWQQQRALFRELPKNLANMALFKVNTGAREQEVCQLQWDWEYEIPGATVFMLPGHLTKNGKPRPLVLNRVAANVIKAQRGIDKNFVFIGNRGTPLQKINNNPWRQAWKRAGLPIDDKYKRGVHNLRHTFGQRLRAAGVSEEDRAVLLGHTNKSLTTHYSAPEIYYMIDQANKVCDERKEVILRKVS